MLKIKKKIYNFIRDDESDSIISKIIDGTIITLIIINVLAVIADTFALPAWMAPFLTALELVSVVVFSTEYVLRVWTADFFVPRHPATSRTHKVYF